MTCDATCTLRDAIDDANNTAGSDTIVFSSLFNSPQTITLAGTVLTINSATGDTTTITGPGANLLTVSGNNVSRVFVVSPGDTASISDLTITQGNSLTGNFPGFGGGIYSQGILTVTNLVVTGNSATIDDGGIYNSVGDTLIVNSCVITTNISNSDSSGSGDGGGIYSENGSILTITNSTISGNTAQANSSTAGGVRSDDGSTVNISNSTISNNMSASTGGGIQFSGERDCKSSRWSMRRMRW